MVRLLSIGTLSLGMLFSQASLIVPAVPVVAAAAPAARETRAKHSDNSAIPESNPYADPSQCIYRAWDLAAEAGHRLPWFAGNATDWKEGAIEADLTVTDKLGPDSVNSVAVWQGGVGGTGSAGHVGWVAKVDVEGGRFLVKDRNWIPAADDERWVTWEEGISFITFAQPEPEQPAPAPEPAPAEPAPTAVAPAPESAPALMPSASLNLLTTDPIQLARNESARALQGWTPGQPVHSPWSRLLRARTMPPMGLDVGQPPAVLPLAPLSGF